MNWYRRKRRKTESGTDRILENTKGERRKTQMMNKVENDKDREELRNAAVHIVENTKNSALAKSMRETMEKMKHILVYNVKIVERAVTPLKLMFPLSNIGEGESVGVMTALLVSRIAEERDSPLVGREVSYICLRCNPDTGGDVKKKERTPPDHPPSIYVGETARSLYKRGNTGGTTRQYWRTHIS